MIRCSNTVARRSIQVMSQINASKNSFNVTSIHRMAARSTAPTQSLLPFPPACRMFSSSTIVKNAPSSQSQSNSTNPLPPKGANTDTSKAERTRRRFWKKVDIAYAEGKPKDHLLIRLDGRSLKTPSGAVLAIPTDRSLLASLIAREWSEQESILHTHSLPLTSLAARAIDGLTTPKEREGVLDALIEYLRTETICFHENHPTNLVKLQEQHWIPILRWTEEYFKTPPINVFDDIFDVKQDEKVIEVLREYVLKNYNGFDLAALERMVRSTKSFLIGLRLTEAIRQGGKEEGKFSVHDAALAAEVEVQSQTERWGEVEDTHDVDFADLRKILGSATCALVRDTNEVAKQVAQEIVSTGGKK